MNLISHPERAVVPLLLTSLLAACGGGSDDSTRDDASKATAQAVAVGQVYTGTPPPLRPGAPRAESGRGSSVGIGTHLTAPTRHVAAPTHCVVDFNDSATLQLTGPSLWFDRVILPWYQQCGSGGYVEFKPTVHNHFHLGFVDPDVLPCLTNAQAYPSRIDNDGNCQLVNIANEPRTYATNHLTDEVFHMRAKGPSNTNWTAFALNRFRVVGSGAVKLCYKKAGAFAEFEAAHPSNSAPWMCWNELGAGTWDLSQYAWDIKEVKILASPAGTGIFSVVDFHVGVGP